MDEEKKRIKDSESTEEKISRGKVRTQTLFDKYKTNLNFVVDNGFLDGDKDFYICPICLKEHKNINENDPLSLEDAPPKALGGKANTLTCTKCNNKCGVTIDNQLVKRLRQMEQEGFFPFTTAKVEMEHKETVVKGLLRVDKDGNPEISVKKEKNQPEKYEKFTDNVNDEVVHVKIDKEKLNKDYIEFALLKTAYMLFFEKTGYAYIYDDCFDIIRKQIQHPEERLIPEKFYFMPPYPKEMSGVYFILDKGIESVFVMFNIDTDTYNKTFGVLLPLGENTLAKIQRKLIEKFKKERRFAVKLQPVTDDFLTDAKK